MTENATDELMAFAFSRELLLISLKRNRPSQWFNCRKIDGRPVTFFRRRVCIGSPRNPGNSNYGLFRRRYGRKGLHRRFASCEDYFAQQKLRTPVQLVSPSATKSDHE